LVRICYRATTAHSSVGSWRMKVSLQIPKVSFVGWVKVEKEIKNVQAGVPAC
jgi:hypothetical protein